MLLELGPSEEFHEDFLRPSYYLLSGTDQVSYFLRNLGMLRTGLRQC